MNNIRKQFSFFSHNKDVVFLDSGASSLTPDVVTDAVADYYRYCSVNIHRGLYELSDNATIQCEQTRKEISSFIGAKTEEIIITPGTTLGCNMLAQMLAPQLDKKSNIVISIAEHHANILPWQKLCKEIGCELRYIPLTDDYYLDMDKAKQLIDKDTKIVSITGMSNVLGTMPDIKKLGKLAHAVNAYMIVDAAQLIAHREVDVQDMDCDFLLFGAHKMYGPSGVGVLYGKKEILATLEPAFVGGDIVTRVTKQTATWTTAPYKFETGTPAIASIIGLGKAIQYIQEIGWDSIEKHDQSITQYGLETLSQIKGLTIVGPPTHKQRGATFSFTIDGMHTHDIAEILAQQHIAIRAGSHCAMPLSIYLGINGTARASCGIYTTKKDIDALANAINQAKQLFSV